MTALSDSGVLRFGPFELQPRERRLLAGGRPVPLGGRALDLLLVLAERPDQLVTREELLDRVWPDLVVEDNNIAVQVSSLRKVLGSEAIATVPGRGYRFMLPVQRSVAASGPASAAAATAPSPEDDGPALHGREPALSEAQALLARCRVVTLAGPGGVGKSALARQLTRRPPCDGRAAWVSLAALSDPGAVPARIAEAMGLVLVDSTLAALVAALERRMAGEAAPRWVVLDNAEHLVDAVARVLDALATVPALHLLATSQVPLGIPGESVLRLPTLAVPADSAGVDEALAHGAIALFVERARAAERRFVLTPERVPAVAEICRRLDGLPLALEMAAARLPLLGLDGLRRSLDERFKVLVRPRGLDESRHTTLKAALDWSHDQLDGPEQRVLRRCAVFNGGFTLDLMAAVVDLPAVASEASADRWEAVDALGGLVARSLVVTEGLDAPRYRLLETVRAYAAERLQAAGEADAAARRHAEALRDFFAAERRRVHEGRPVSESMPRCVAEFDNLGRAVEWCLAHAPTLAVELVAEAGIFTVHSLRRRDAERWLAACEPHEHRVANPELRGEYLLELTRARVMKGDPSAADAARRALAVFTAAGHEAGEFRALTALLRGAAGPDPELDRAALRMQELSGRHPEWPVSYHMGNTGALARWAAINQRFAEALALRREEAEWAARAGNPMMQRAALSNTVNMLGRLGRHEEAVEVGEALRKALQGQPDQSNRAYTCLFLANSLTALGRLDEATQVALEGEALMQALDLPVMGPLLALLAARRGWPRHAARLAGWAQARYEARKLPMQDDAKAQHDEAVQAALAALGHVTLALELGNGRRLDDHAVPALLQAGRDAAPDETAAPATMSRDHGDG